MPWHMPSHTLLLRILMCNHTLPHKHLQQILTKTGNPRPFSASSLVAPLLKALFEEDECQCAIWFFLRDTIGLIFFSFGPSSNSFRKVGILSGKERTYTMNGLFALGQSVPWLTNDHFEKNLFENSLMPHLTQQLLLPFLLHVHKPFLYMQPLLEQPIPIHATTAHSMPSSLYYWLSQSIRVQLHCTSHYKED